MNRVELSVAFVFSIVSMAGLSAQGASFSIIEKKEHQFQQALTIRSLDRVEHLRKFNPCLFESATKTVPIASIMSLPKWSAETLPFFCRIEHNWAKQHRIPLKFRLGSVEYVDWLEGK